MKALTIRQPWATLIVMGIKNIENRSWTTKYRGELLIHAGKKKDKKAMQTGEHLCRKIGVPFPEDFPLGAYVGMVNFSGVVYMKGLRLKGDTKVLEEKHFRGYEYVDYGFVLTNPRSMPIIPANGRLGLFNPEDEIVAQVQEFIREGKLIPSNPQIPAPKTLKEKILPSAANKKWKKRNAQRIGLPLNSESQDKE